MLKGICKLLLKMGGWTPVGGDLDVKKCIILGAPHTSNWDFVWSWVFYTSVGGKAYVMVKQELFKGILKPILKGMGGIPVDRKRGANMIMQVAEEFKKRDKMQLAIALEGTRKPTARWKAGFHAIAKMADVPVYFGIFDYGQKRIGIVEEFELSDDARADLIRAKRFYKDVVGKYPENFTVGKLD